MFPDIYFFNPTCELAVANGSPWYTPPAGLRKMESDLGCLPAWLGREKDQVLTSGNTASDWEERLRSLGIRLPAIARLEEAFADQEWLQKPRGRICPWGWSPAANRLFGNLHSFCREEFRASPVAAWLPEHRNLYSRLTGSRVLEWILGEAEADWLPGKEDLPVVCTNLEEVYRAISRFPSALVKSPWSSSGRGLIRFPNHDRRDKNDELLSGMLRQQSFVTVERWLDKVIDLSYQFSIENGAASYLGRTFFETDKRGRYQLTWIPDRPVADPATVTFLESHQGNVVDLLTRALASSDYARLYEGWIGVDAMIYRDSNGKLKFRPVVEINGRFTMGAIALRLRNLVAKDKESFLMIRHSASQNFKSWCEMTEAKHPLRTGDKGIESGFLPLTPPLEEHHFGAFLMV